MLIPWSQTVIQSGFTDLQHTEHSISHHMTCFDVCFQQTRFQIVYSLAGWAILGRSICNPCAPAPKRCCLYCKTHTNVHLLSYDNEVHACYICSEYEKNPEILPSFKNILIYEVSYAMIWSMVHESLIAEKLVTVVEGRSMRRSTNRQRSQR